MKTFKDYLNEGSVTSLNEAKTKLGWDLSGSITFSESRGTAFIETYLFGFKSPTDKTSLYVQSGGELVWSDSTQALINNPSDLLAAHKVITQAGPVLKSLLTEKSVDKFLANIKKLEKVIGTPLKVLDGSKGDMTVLNVTI